MATETIGDLGGLYPSSVRAMIVKLVEHGHLAVVWGRKGRGHPNRYSMIVKPQEAAVSSSGKPQQAAVSASLAKPQPSELKPQPDDHKTAASRHELLRNHLNNQEAAPPPALVTPVVMEDRERAFGALMEAYPNKARHADSRVTFDQLLDDGLPSHVLIAEAKLYAIKCIGMNPKQTHYLCRWLKVEAQELLEASYFKSEGCAEIGIAPNAGAGKIYQSHYEGEYGPES